MNRVNMGLVCFLILAVSCGKEDYDYTKGEVSGPLQRGEGSVALNLSTVSGESLSFVNPEEFTVEVLNASGVKIKRWNRYADIENPIKLNAGNFTLHAFRGDSTATGFDAVCFAGKAVFVVEGQTHKALSVTCRQSNVQMKIHWGANLVEDYRNYTVKVYRGGFADSLAFVKEETRSGYIPAGKLKFKIYLTDKQGKESTYSSPSMDMDAWPNDLINLTVDTKEITYGVHLSFEIDSSTTDRVFDILIPGWMKPANFPR